MDSRSLASGEELMAATGGRGVDVVLNSLADDHVPTSLGVLAPGGRFLEIGKRGVWEAERVEAFRPGIRYHRYDLAALAHDEPETVQALLAEIVAAVEVGEIAPSPHRVFPLEDAAAAFRHMAQARHVGKIVLAVRGGGEGSPRLRPDRTYLVTGGLGALGLATAEHLADRGARHLLLAGRGTPSTAARRAIAALAERGVQAVPVQADVTVQADAERLVRVESAGLPALAGVVHAAGVVDDALLRDLDPERWARVMAPKVRGAWNLHRASRDLPLDFFVLYASAAGLLGSPGQGNYAAANAFLDALAYYRRARGLTALSVDWGPWAGDGMAAAGVRGLWPLAPEAALAALDGLLAEGRRPQAAVLDADWPELLARYPAGGAPPLLSELSLPDAAAAVGADREALAAELARTPAARRRTVVVDYLRRHAARVLGVGEGRLPDPATPLQELGLDSLMAVELRNALRAGLGAELPVTLLFEHPTLDALAGHLLQEVLGHPAAEAAADDPPESEAAHEADLVEEIRGLSQAELEARILREAQSCAEGGSAG
jgi:NAD(P)-dependent dehydrogenase (short-subunit alcohol dehydrogenase family)/acyl carrier protein